jgi:tetratricopeptide (TPR) repeat protein
MNLRGLITGIVLLLIYLISIWYRVRLGKYPEYYDSTNPIAYYWTENALQYHYAELIAQGKSIPAFDPQLQAPDGVKTFENLTILMEYPCGWLYRIFKLRERGMLFHTWTIIYIAGCASLGIFGIYLLSRAIGMNHFYSILAGLLSNFSLVGVGRSTFGFLNEDFALPFITFGLASYLYALRSSQKRIFYSLIAGGFFLISLCAWHFSRFIFLALILVSIINLWFFEKPQRAKNFATLLFFLLLIPFIGSLIVPVLRSRLYFLSSPFTLSFGSILGILLFKPEGEKTIFFSTRGWLVIIPGLLFLSLGILISNIFKTEAEYIHVWSLILNKIKFFGIKPANPELLDYPARSLWIEAFNSPHPVSLFKNLFPIFLPALFGFSSLLKEKNSESHIRILLSLCLIFFLGYLTIERLGIINNYFLALLSVAIGSSNKRIFKYFVPVSLIIIFLFNFYQGYNLHTPTRYIKILRKIFGNESSQYIYNWRLNNVELVRFIRLMTPDNAIFLSSFGVGPLILTYANRPIVLQPKFEVRDCQNRVREFLEKIYDTEEEFFELCKKWRVDYFLYDIKILLDNSRDGSRWVAGRMNVSLNSTAFLMHFYPERLKHYELVYQNNFYRLYRVIYGKESPVHRDHPYHPVYDITLFGNQNKDGSFDDRYTLSIMERIRQAKLLLQKANNILTKHPAQARELMEKSILLYPSLIGSMTTIGIALALEGKVESGISFCVKEVEANPLFPLAHYNLAYCHYLNGNIQEAVKELNIALELEPNFPPALKMLKELIE